KLDILREFSKKTAIYGDKKPIINGPRCDVPLDDVDGNIIASSKTLAPLYIVPSRSLEADESRESSLKKTGFVLWRIRRTDRASREVMLAFKCLRQSITLGF
ncbi:hypothetical protein BYT27DRAFT_7205313, partial [Phlegmacium glaucopus]